MGTTARRLGWLVLFGAAVVGSPRAQASVVEALDLAALTAAAEDVIVAQVVVQTSHYDEHGRIVTDVELVVQQSEKGGTAPGSTVLVRRLGGVVNGIGMRIEGEPSFVNGERALFFAHRAGARSVLRAVGMAQGVLRISEREGESWVASATAGAALVRPSLNGHLTKARAAVERPRRLQDVLSEIRALVAKAKGPR